MEEVLGYPEQATQAQSEKATALFLSWTTRVPGIGPVSRLGTAPAGRCQNFELMFPTKTTEALVTACKHRGISMTAAIHAAYVGAIVKHADPKSKLEEYVTAPNFNLRPYLPEPYSSSKHAVSVYYTPLPYKIDLPASYWDIARSLHKYYQTSFKGNPETLEITGYFTQALFSAVQTPEFLANPVSKDALISSLGIAERYVQREYGSDIKVKDIKIGIDVVMGMSFFFFYTFRDQLRLVYSFNDGFEEAENIQMYLEEVQAVLVKELLA
ncbi:hypothetical protein F5B20DRAFT_528043 [Whalleya microplaca]|nr:hypothetical protein F5B20DRAFT_528043 [Whalleya microplaca]